MLTTLLLCIITEFSILDFDSTYLRGFRSGSRNFKDDYLLFSVKPHSSQQKRKKENIKEVYEVISRLL